MRKLEYKMKLQIFRLEFDYSLKFQTRLSTNWSKIWVRGVGKNLALTGDIRIRLKPGLVQGTDYMVEKTYHLTPY